MGRIWNRRYDIWQDQSRHTGSFAGNQTRHPSTGHGSPGGSWCLDSDLKVEGCKSRCKPSRRIVPATNLSRTWDGEVGATSVSHCQWIWNDSGRYEEASSWCQRNGSHGQGCFYFDNFCGIRKEDQIVIHTFTSGWHRNYCDVREGSSRCLSSLLRGLRWQWETTKGEWANKRTAICNISLGQPEQCPVLWFLSIRTIWPPNDQEDKTIWICHWSWWHTSEWWAHWSHKCQHVATELAGIQQCLRYVGHHWFGCPQQVQRPHWEVSQQVWCRHMGLALPGGCQMSSWTLWES